MTTRWLPAWRLPTLRLPTWWPLAGLTLLAATLRFSTLDLQSLWYDEAFTPVHVLHVGLGATLRAMVHTENTPPLWYVLEWGVTRVLGTGAVALRLLSALAGVATVPVAWAIGRELSDAGRDSARSPAAIAAAALVAANPLFVWYSQEARAYGLFVLTSALAILCFLRVEHALSERSRRRRLPAFAVTASLALLTHYFAFFLVAPMALWLLGRRAGRRTTLLAVGAVGLVCAALVPLALAQGGHGAQWIERWALSARLQAIPQYYLTGNSGAPLGHGVELLVALALLAGLGYGLWRVLEPGEERGALTAFALSACGVLAPILLVAFGADYLAPRNLVAAMVPVTALFALVITARRTGRTGQALAVVLVWAFLLISADVDLSPRLQRGNWRGVARLLDARQTVTGDLNSVSASGGRDGVGSVGGGGPTGGREGVGSVGGGGPTGGREGAGSVGGGDGSGSRERVGRVITTVELGAAPLEYYIRGLRNLPRSASVTVGEIDEIGYAPLRRSAGRTPAPGFRLLSRTDVDGLIVYRFASAIPRSVSEAALRRAVITSAHPEVLVPSAGQIPSSRKTN